MLNLCISVACLPSKWSRNTENHAAGSCSQNLGSLGGGAGVAAGGGGGATATASGRETAAATAAVMSCCSGCNELLQRLWRHLDEPSLGGDFGQAPLRSGARSPALTMSVLGCWASSSSTLSTLRALGAGLLICGSATGGSGGGSAPCGLGGRIV